MATWEHSIIDISQDHFVSKSTRTPHTFLMMIICDHGMKQGLMATNVTNNFARELKPQQLRHFFNQHVCHHDNIDLFYGSLHLGRYMQDPQDFYYYNLGIYSSEEIKDKNKIQKWTRAPRDLSPLQLPNLSLEPPINAPFNLSKIE
jgi:hypothetical protein